MILKEADDKSSAISELQKLVARASGQQQKDIKRELAIVRAGIKGERESAYFLDFHFKNSKNSVLIHDLRIEHNGRVAQIDHLLLTRMMAFYVMETKHFSDGLKIDENEQFLRWNEWRNKYEGMASPIEQAERQGIVLRDLISSLEWPTRAGLKLMPTIKPRVLISPDARLILPTPAPKAAEFTVKADVFLKHFQADIDKEGVLATLASAAKIIARDTVEEMGRTLVACHKPKAVDYAAKFGMTKDASACRPSVMPAAEVATASPMRDAAHACRYCQSADLEMVYGKFGYYFKCRACTKNTPPPNGCEEKGCTSRIRKAGRTFTQYCEACAWERLFYTNAAAR
jgi:hypothetical protein